VNRQGVPFLAAKLQHPGQDITADYDLAVQWIHANAPDLGGKKPDLIKNGRSKYPTLPLQPDAVLPSNVHRQTAWILTKVKILKSKNVLLRIPGNRNESHDD
jgi:hypothetical protein